MGKEGFKESTMPAGEQTNKEAREEDGGHGNDSSLYNTYWYCKCDSESDTFASKCEAACTEEKDEPWREKSSEVSLLLGKYPARTYLQVLGEAQRGGDD